MSPHQKYLYLILATFLTLGLIETTLAQSNQPPASNQPSIDPDDDGGINSFEDRRCGFGPGSFPFPEVPPSPGIDDPCYDSWLAIFSIYWNTVLDGAGSACSWNPDWDTDGRIYNPMYCQCIKNMYPTILDFWQRMLMIYYSNCVAHR